MNIIKYKQRLKYSYRSLRTKVNLITVSLLTVISTVPDESKHIATKIMPKSWVDNNWTTIIAIVAIISVLFHLHGTAREISEVPYEDRGD